MTEQATPPDSDNEIILDEGTVAAAVLTSEQSWEVLNGLYAAASQKILSTEGFVVPVMNQMAVLKEKLKDPVAFERSFTTLINDIRKLSDRLRLVFAQHSGKSGEPTQEEWTLTFSISQEYSNIITEFDVVIAPLIFSLIETIRDEHGDMLQVPGVEEVQQ